MAGILFAILLIFLQLGFYSSVPKGGLLFYEAMRFDLMLTSSSYVFEAQSGSFPRRRLYQALAVTEVARASAMYQGIGRWLNDEDQLARDVFVIGFNPAEGLFNVPQVDQQSDLLRQPDTILVDKATRPSFGPLEKGRRIELEQRSVQIGGVYTLGTGFLALGIALTSDVNFVRIFPNRSLNQVNLGLLILKPGADPDQTAIELRRILPADTQVFTRNELYQHETGHWVTRTSTGLIFGFGALVAMVVGLVILKSNAIELRSRASSRNTPPSRPWAILTLSSAASW